MAGFRQAQVTELALLTEHLQVTELRLLAGGVSPSMHCLTPMATKARDLKRQWNLPTLVAAFPDTFLAVDRGHSVGLTEAASSRHTSAVTNLHGVR